MNKKTQKQEIGLVGENIAAAFLTKKGFSIIEKNYRQKWGEIDIIAQKDGAVRFIEVKTKSVGDTSYKSSAYHPEEHVTHDKLRKITRTASLYMESKKDSREYQIDVVAVVLDKIKRIARCRLYEQVLEN